MDAHTLENRLERCVIFCSYLDKCWADLASGNLPFDWPEVSRKVKDLVLRIARRVAEDQRGFEF